MRVGVGLVSTFLPVTVVEFCLNRYRSAVGIIGERWSARCVDRLIYTNHVCCSVLCVCVLSGRICC